MKDEKKQVFFYKQCFGVDLIGKPKIYPTNELSAIIIKYKFYGEKEFDLVNHLADDHEVLSFIEYIDPSLSFLSDLIKTSDKTVT